MNGVTLRSFINEETKDEVLIEMVRDGETLGQVRLSASETEQFIHEVASSRAKLVEKVPMQYFSDLERIKPTKDPKWHHVRYGASGGHSMASHTVSFRHPGLGWIPFKFSDTRDAYRLSILLGTNPPE